MRAFFLMIILSLTFLASTSCSSMPLPEANDLRHDPDGEPPLVETTTAIMNGSLDKKNAWDSIVMIEFDERGDDFCSGSLLSPHLVLTAAHCFCEEGAFKRSGPTDIDSKSRLCSGKNPKRVRIIRYDEDTVEETATSSDEMDVVLNPDFKMRFECSPRKNVDGSCKYVVSKTQADLAVIFLNEPLNGATIRFRTPPTDRDVEDGEELVAIGYGKTLPGEASTGSRHIGTNRATREPSTLPALSYGGEKYSRELIYFEEVRKAAEGEFELVHVLSGDSGGPGLARRKSGDAEEFWLVGVISMSSSGEWANSRRRMRRSIFTSTFVHRAWIEAQKKEAERRLAESAREKP